MTRLFFIVSFFLGFAEEGLSLSEAQLIKDMFKRAQTLAAEMVQDVTVDDLSFEHLPDDAAQSRVRRWYQARIKGARNLLAEDILASKHTWNTDPQQTSCGKTGHTLLADIWLNEAACLASITSPAQAAKLLIGESAHHFPQIVNDGSTVTGDTFSDWVKIAIYDAWTKKGGEIADSTEPDEVEVLRGGRIYVSRSFSGVLWLTGALTFNLGQDKRAYAGFNVQYNLRTTPGNPNGILQEVKPINEAFINPPGVEQQKFSRNEEGLYTATAVMGYPGKVRYDLGGGYTYTGPGYCKIPIALIARPLHQGKVLNLTIRRPRWIKAEGCQRGGNIEEHIGFRAIN